MPSHHSLKFLIAAAATGPDTFDSCLTIFTLTTSNDFNCAALFLGRGPINGEPLPTRQGPRALFQILTSTVIAVPSFFEEMPEVYART